MDGERHLGRKPIWFDDGESLDDELFDASLRRHFNEAFPIGDQSWEALQDVRPMVVRVRRRRQATRAFVTLAAASLAVALAAIGLAVPNESADEIVVAGPGGDGVSSGSPDDPQLSTEESRPPGLPGANGDGTTSAQTPAASADLDETSTTAPPTTESGASSRTQTSIEAPTTTTVNTSSLPPTTTVESACGSIGFEVDGSEVRLVETIPTGSYQAEVKNSGPEKIEVTFEGGDKNCELEIQFVDGELRIKEDD